jgi:hypothetical protein
MLRVAELAEIVEGLEPSHAMKVHLSDGSPAGVVITYVQPTVIEEAIQGGFFDPSQVWKALHLTRNMGTYSTKVSYLLPTLSSGTTHVSGPEQPVLHAMEEIEETRQAIVAEARLLSEQERKFEVRNIPARSAISE